eukprot:12120068-Alexandrium_andersonii.AAC.1
MLAGAGVRGSPMAADRSRGAGSLPPWWKRQQAGADRSLLGPATPAGFGEAPRALPRGWKAGRDRLTWQP